VGAWSSSKWGAILVGARGGAFLKKGCLLYSNFSINRENTKMGVKVFLKWGALSIRDINLA
jgi:hypothetical protein